MEEVFVVEEMPDRFRQSTMDFFGDNALVVKLEKFVKVLLAMDLL